MSDEPRLWNLLTEPTVLVIVTVSVLLAWPVGGWIAARFGCARWAAGLFVVAVGGVLALTATDLSRNLLLPTGTGSLVAFLGRLGDLYAVHAELQSFAQEPDEVPNIALFVPVGFFGLLVCRRAWLAVGFGVALTVAVESWQALIGRSSEVSDVVHNSAGAILGVGVAVVVTSVARRAARSSSVEA